MPEVILSRKTASEVRKLIDGFEDSVEVALSETQISFSVGDATLYSRLIEGKFVDYQLAIPQENFCVLLVNTLKQTFGRNGMRRGRRSMTSSTIRHCPRLPMTPKPELGAKGGSKFWYGYKKHGLSWIIQVRINQQGCCDPGQRDRDRDRCIIQKGPQILLWHC